MGYSLRKTPFSVSTCQQKAEEKNHQNTKICAYTHIYRWEKWKLWGIQPAPEVFEGIQIIAKLEIMGLLFPIRKMTNMKQSHHLVCTETGVKTWLSSRALTSPFPGVWCECMLAKVSLRYKLTKGVFNSC